MIIIMISKKKNEEGNGIKVDYDHFEEENKKEMTKEAQIMANMTKLTGISKVKRC
jgi:hypothetical protein